jgi:hypothetical protein
MLINLDRKYISVPFVNEAELEKVVADNYEHLFGPDSFYLPKTRIRTSDGTGTIPDGFAIDLSERKWYIVEAELGHHPVWDHIVRQVSKQIVASLQPETKQILEDLSVELYGQDDSIKEKFNSLAIPTVDVRKVIRDILEGNPIIGIPIDTIPNDLRDWSYQQKHEVKLWIVRKFAEFRNSANIIYELPEQKPVVDTASSVRFANGELSKTKYDVSLFDLIEKGLIRVSDKLLMSYKPRNGIQRTYGATVMQDGSMELLGNIYGSPSYAALAGIQDAGSSRETVNGWTSWKASNGKTLAELRDTFLSGE